jgi:glycerol-3-phosphate acyltransferase PlsY
MDYVGFALLSYVLGSVPFGVLVARLHGIDLMAVGSGNTGATNVTRALGWKLGLLVFVLDVAKGAAPPVVAMSVFHSEAAAVLMGVAAVVGHTFSPFLKFRGGKGVATSLGVLFGSAPIVGVAVFAVFLALFALTRIVSLSSLTATACVIIVGLLTHQGWVFFAVFGPLVLYVFVRHRDNIVRLMKGEERKLDIRARLKKDENTEEGKDSQHDG